MIEYILSLGDIGLFSALLVAYIIVKSILNAYWLFVKKGADDLAKLGRDINALLFWGAVIVILGFIGTFIGIPQITDNLLTNEIYDIRVLSAGIHFLLRLPVFCFSSFLGIMIVWYVLINQHKILLKNALQIEHADR